MSTDDKKERPEQCGHMAPGRKGECPACRAMYVDPLPEPQPMAGLDALLPQLEEDGHYAGCPRLRGPACTCAATDACSGAGRLADDVGYVRRGLMQALGEIPAEKVPPAFRPRLCRHGKVLCAICVTDSPRYLVGPEEPTP